MMHTPCLSIEVRRSRRSGPHAKILALVGVFGKKRFAISATAGRPYASEIKLAEPLLKRLQPAPGSYILGDKGFDCIRLLELIKKKKCRPVIAIKESSRMAVRDPLRMLSRKNVANPRLYNRRTLIEGLFGNIKQKLSSHVRVFKLQIAQLFSLLRLALFNMSVLIHLEKTGLAWVMVFEQR
ncbi:MAG TPA: transposase [Candidatus Paceibacterota bacterium]